MEWVSGNIFIRPNTLYKIGDKCNGHTHNFDHTTIVFKGAVHVKTATKGTKCLVCDGGGTDCLACEGRGYDLVPGREGDFSAGSHFLVYKDTYHEITATEPNTVFWCVYAHNTPQGSISQVYDGWLEAYH